MHKQKIKKNSKQIFSDNLRTNGYRSYDEYLKSETWKAFNAWYRKESAVPHQCLVCGNPRYQLHHWTYVRVCMENLGDVVPLCDEHHEEIHRFIKSTRTRIDNLVFQLTECFGFSHEDAMKMTRFTRRKSRSAARKRRRREGKRTSRRHARKQESRVLTPWVGRRANGLQAKLVKEKREAESSQEAFDAKEAGLRGKPLRLPEGCSTVMENAIRKNWRQGVSERLANR